MCFRVLSYPLHCHPWPDRLYHILPHNLLDNTVFQNKKLLNIKHMFLFSVEPLSVTSVILRRVLRYTITNVHTFLYKVPVILVK